MPGPTPALDAATLSDPPDQPAHDHPTPANLAGSRCGASGTPPSTRPARRRCAPTGRCAGLTRTRRQPATTARAAPTRGTALSCPIPPCANVSPAANPSSTSAPDCVTLVATAPATAVHDLTGTQTCVALGADPALGDDRAPDVYARTQRWAQYLHRTPGVRGLRYWSARHRGAADRRHGINILLWRKGAPRQAVHQHRLINDVLWPHILVALDRARVAANRIPACPRC